MAETKETRNYGSFDLYYLNRPIGDTTDLEKSMLEHGWLDGIPMLVVRGPGGRFIILDGHHRFWVARKLGIPVKYTIVDRSVSLQGITGTSRKWSKKDFLYAHVNAKNPHYIYLKIYHERTGIDLSRCVTILGTETWHMLGKDGGFENGKFQIKNQEAAEHLATVICLCRDKGMKHSSHRPLVDAFQKVLKVKQLDMNRLLTMLAKHWKKIDKLDKVAQYLDAIQNVYNMSKKGKDIPLRFLAETAGHATPEWKE